MKKRILLLLATILAVATLICGFAFAAHAEEAKTPTVSIDKFNLVFEDNVYLKYAVKFEGVADSEINATNIGMLYFTTPMDDYTKGGEAYASAVVGYQTIEGQKYYTFEYRHITAKQMIDYIYSVAYIDIDGERIYSAPVKYSVLDYCCSKLGKTGVASENEDYRNLLNATLTQGAMAQKYFNYKTERLANAEYYLVEVVGGTLEDGFTKGLYHSDETATLTAPEINGELKFLEWKNADNKIVSVEKQYNISSISSNQCYTSNYAEIPYSKGLDIVGGYVRGIGSCTDSEIKIPPISNGYEVDTIENEAFYNCTNLVSVVLPETIKKIGEEAFYQCCDLKIINLPSQLTSIGRYAFQGCTDLESSIIIPEGITTISDGAFWSCYSLTDIVLPNNLTTIGNSSFAGCRNLQNVVIPDTVTVIGDHAFQACSRISSLTLGKNVNQIDNSAFYACDRLVEIINKSSLKLEKGSTSNGWVAYEALEIHNGESKLKLHDDFLFYTCDGVNYLIAYTGPDVNVILPDSYNGEQYVIKSNAFYRHYITSITIGEGVSNIQRSAFNYCETLVEVINKSSLNIVKGSDSYGGIAQYALEVHGGESKIVEKDDYLFYTYDDAHYLVNYIGNATDLILPDNYNNSNYEINRAAFYYNSKIESVVIPDGVTAIGDYAFDNCKKLKEITTGNNVNHIGYCAFNYCESLKSIIISESVRTISNYAFYECSDLTIYCEATEQPVGWSSNWNYHNCPIIWGYVEIVTIDGIQYMITKEGASVIGYTGAATELIIPDAINGVSVISISYNVFDDCDSLMSIIIGNNITSIGSYAFYDCDSLMSIIIGNNVTSIGSSAFYSCSKLIEVINKSSLNITSGSSSNGYVAYYAKEVHTGDTKIVNKDNFLFYTCNGVNYLFGYSGTDSDLILPDSYKGENYEIYERAFYSCEEIISVVIPEGVTAIGNYAFYGCKNLTNIVIPNSVTAIGRYAFDYCKSLESVIFENPNGWWYTLSSTATSGASISNTYLADAQTAATYLKSTYSYYYWNRT